MFYVKIAIFSAEPSEIKKKITYTVCIHTHKMCVYIYTLLYCMYLKDIYT